MARVHERSFEPPSAATPSAGSDAIGASPLARWLLRRILKTPTPPQYDEEWFRERQAYDVESTRRFFARFGSGLDVRGASVLDVGCGRGSLCVEAARRGARRVVGVDIRPVDWAHELVRRHPGLAPRITLLQTAGALEELAGERFDVVLSKDSFEHYANPESFVFTLAGLVRPGGHLAIGFGPLWKSPQGGHLDFMTGVPWAHLLFSEGAIMAERRRFRPGEAPRRYEEVPGGLNRMTLARFRRIMASSGLECLSLETNVSDHPVVRGMKLAGRFPPLREYLTANVYGVWRMPGEEASRASEGS